MIYSRNNLESTASKSEKGASPDFPLEKVRDKYAQMGKMHFMFCVNSVRLVWIVTPLENQIWPEIQLTLTEGKLEKER